MTHDIYIKDEGEFATICFITEKAKKAIKKSIGGGNIPSPFTIAPTEAYHILAWAITWNLTVDSEISIRCGGK